MKEWFDKIDKETILNFIKQLITPEVILQIGLFVLILLIARFIRKKLEKWQLFSEAAILELPWLKSARTVLIETIYPFIVYALLKVSGKLLEQFELPTDVLDWIASLLMIAFLYSILYAIIRINMKEQQAHFWGRSVLMPITITFVVLSGLGLLNDVLGWGFTIPNSEVRLSVGSLLLGLFFMLLFYYAGKGIRHFLSNYFLPKSGLEPALIQGISTLVSYTVIIIGTITALSATGIDLTALTVVVGGLSVGLGFGLQAIVSNFISGFVLLFEKSVGPGDIINIADKTGTVQHVGIRSITILTRDHIELIVPNSYYLTEVVTNLTRTSRNIRLAILVGVSYNADPKEVKEALLASAETDYVMKLPAAEVQFLDFGESSLDFRLLIWTNRPELSMVIGSNIRYNIWEQLKKRNIEIPFPQRDLHIRSGIEHLSGTVKNTSAKK